MLVLGPQLPSLTSSFLAVAGGAGPSISEPPQLPGPAGRGPGPGQDQAEGEGRAGAGQ